MRAAAAMISIDALNTFPEMYWQGDKVDLGDITLAVQGSSGPPHDDRDAHL